MNRLLLLALAPLLLANRFPDHERYDDCVALVRQNAAAAFSKGLDWKDQGGGVAAQHCAALALSAMGKDEAAAELFLEAANAAVDGKGVQLMGMEVTPALLAELFAQAGHSYILADKPDDAITTFTQALEHLPIASPPGADIMADRARAMAMTGNLEGAFTDLSVAVGIRSDDADILLLRASAARQTGRYDIARSDIDRVLSLRADMASAWLEKAQLALQQDAPTMARKSLMQAIALDDGGPVAEAARYLLEQLALGSGG